MKVLLKWVLLKQHESFNLIHIQTTPILCSMIFPVCFFVFPIASTTFIIIEGVGTLEFKRATYLNQVNFPRYDFCRLFFVFIRWWKKRFILVLIISRTRFTENDLWLANEVKKNGKHFFFIRTNIDQDLYNEKIDHPSTYNETVVLNRIRENCLAHVRTVDETASVFLISGRINHTSR